MAEQDHSQRALVDVMIVGAQKAGTTALVEYLAMHPSVERQLTPEMTWFTDPTLDNVDIDALSRRYFPESSGRSVRVGKLAGLMYEPSAVDRLRQHVPGVVVVACLRNPVRRAYSAFLHARVRGREPIADFAAALDGDPARFVDEASRRTCAYLERGEYAGPIERLADAFGSRLHVVFFEDLVQDAKATVTPLLAAQGLDLDGLAAMLPVANPARVTRSSLGRGVQRNKLARRAAQWLAPRARERVRTGMRKLSESPDEAPAIDPLIEDQLRRHFAPGNARLAELLNRPVPAGW